MKKIESITVQFQVKLPDNLIKKMPITMIEDLVGTFMSFKINNVPINDELFKKLDP